MVSCPSPERPQGGLLVVTRLFSQVSKYFTVTFNRFSQLTVSKWFLAEILFLPANNTRHLLITDLLASNGTSSLWLFWHQILLILPFHWEIGQHFYWSIHILLEMFLFIPGISKIDFLLLVPCSCSLQEYPADQLLGKKEMWTAQVSNSLFPHWLLEQLFLCKKLDLAEPLFNTGDSELSYFQLLWHKNT